MSVLTHNKKDEGVGLYVISFNSPKQFETLINSMLNYDTDFINKTTKFLLDNSTDLSTTPRYIEICDEFGFTHIKKDNIGITGGRVFISEHFNDTDLLSYLFFEDDMSLYTIKGEVCKNGFNRYVPNLFNKIQEILIKDNLDFLKLSFTEFFGSHDKQWSWYNVDQEFRQKHWINNIILPIEGSEQNQPNLEFKHIKNYKGLSYATGEIYLSNWPILMSKEGNYKCYIKTKFQYPNENTLMSHCYMETIKGDINPAVLLLSPIEHIRFDLYESKLRKEH